MSSNWHKVHVSLTAFYDCCVFVTVTKQELLEEQMLSVAPFDSDSLFYIHKVCWKTCRSLALRVSSRSVRVCVASVGPTGFQKRN